MSHELIQRLIDKNPTEGSTALSKFADEQGDEFAKEIVEKLTPAELVAISVENDITQPGLAQTLCSPEQIADAFNKLGQRWPITDTVKMGQVLSNRQRDIEGFLCPIILLRNEDEQMAMLRGFIEHPLAAEALAFLGIDKPNLTAILTDPNWVGTEKGTFEELYALVAKNLPETWEDIKATHSNLTSSDEKIQFAIELFSGFHDDVEHPQHAAPTPENDYLDI